MKKGLGLILMGVYIISTVLFCGGTLKEKAGIGAWIFKDMTVSATAFGVMCISAAYPNINMKLADSRDNEGQQDGNDAKGGLAGTVVSAVSTDDEKKPEPVVFGDDPAVLIIHTHATESYLPTSAGNYHTKKAENTVRDVGTVLAQTLKDEGIASVHDQTLHDNPSYSQSYSRSYETAQKLLKKYPSI